MGSVFAWATVTASSPLRVRLDGDADPLDLTPIVLVSPTVGDRVRVELADRQIIIHGIAV